MNGLNGAKRDHALVNEESPPDQPAQPQPARRKKMTASWAEAEPIQHAKKGRLYGGYFGEKTMIVIWQAVLALNNRA